MNEPQDPIPTVAVPSAPAGHKPPDPDYTVHRSSAGADSLDAGLAAGFASPRSSLGDMRPVLLKEAEGNSAHIVKPKSDAMPPPEQTGRRYQLQGEIARGGMGAVLRGRDVDLGRDLAVKVLLEKYVDRPEVARRFLEEAQIGGQLQHPGVVPVYDIGRFGNRPFFTMKLVKGKTLAALLGDRVTPVAHAPGSPTDLPRFLAIALQVTQALAYAHAKGVIHRDLKPANVMVGAFGEVQVMDWGLAKVLAEGSTADEERQSRERERADDASLIRTARSTGSAGTFGTQTEAGSLLGTPAYMPPEQANGEVANLDRRADVFGLAAILCEILTGKPPYVGRSAEEVRRKAANGDLADATARLDGCGADPELIALTKACLAPEPIDRPRDAQAVADALTAYLDGVQERLRQAELAEAEARARAVEEAKRRRLTLALAGTVLLAVTLGGGGWLYVKNERDARQAQTARDVHEALNQAAAFRERARTTPGGGTALFAQAREQAQRALALVESGPIDPLLKDQVARLQADLDEEERDRRLVTALDEARLAQAEAVAAESRFASERAVPKFREAFKAYGLPAGQSEPKAAAKRIRARPPAVCEAIVAALDDWDALAADPKLHITEPHLDWLRAVLAATDPADGWTRRFRAVRDQKDPARRKKALEKLASEAKVETLPVRALTRLASQLERVGAKASAARLLRQAQRNHPADFWVNHNLGLVLRKVRPPERDEAIRFLTTAVALRPQSPGAHCNLGVALKEMGRTDEAIVCYKKSIELAPQSALAHANLGVALVDKGRLADAIVSGRRAIKLDPKNTTAHKSLADTLYEKGQVDEAIDCYQKALVLEPKDPAIHNNLSAALRRKGRLDEAIACLRKAIALDPKDATAHSNLGVALKDKGRLEDAIACHQKAIALDPQYAPARNNLGVALRDRGRLEEAIACYQKAIALDPKYAAAHKNLGIALADKGRTEEAIVVLRTAIELDPKDVNTHTCLAAALNEKGRTAEAIAALRTAIKLDPKDANSHSNLGATLATLGKVDAGIVSLQRALALDPKYVMAHYNLGKALKAKGQVEGAIASFRQALALDPKYAPAHDDLGHALHAKGKVDAAIACFRQALALDPKLPHAHNGLGAIFYRKRDYGAAIACFRQAIAVNPKYAHAHLNLGNALKAKGEVNAAIASFRQAIALDPKLAQAHYMLGAALADRGQVDAAIASYQMAIEVAPNYAEAHCNLGDNLRKQGRFAESLAAYRRGHELGKKQPGWRYPSATWVRQAESLAALERTLLVYLKGKTQPRDMRERLGLVVICQAKKLHHTAARLYADAFEEDPRLANFLPAQHRYQAACFAALAAAGQGKDAARLDEKEKARLRKQALDWLRADLLIYITLSDNGPSEARPLVQEELKHWQQDRDLAGLRDREALAKLSAPEQKAFAQLWADVAALLKKVETPVKRDAKR
jgi:serine/threonine-protein kinase